MKKILGLNRVGGPVLLAVILVSAWFLLSLNTPEYIVPRPQAVVARMGEILGSWDQFQHVVASLLRVIAGLVSAFTIAGVMAAVIARWGKLRTLILPLLRVIQGVPSLSWVVIAVIWFQSVEVRIWYIIMVVTLPGFAFHLYDAYRSVPRELINMGRAFRPPRFALFRTVIFPSILPDIYTSWKVNVGLGVRVVLVAELVGSNLGVGYQLLTAQQFFSMDGVIAWTAVLVAFLLLFQTALDRLERRTLRYRPEGEPAGTGAREPSSPTPADDRRARASDGLEA